MKSLVLLLTLCLFLGSSPAQTGAKCSFTITPAELRNFAYGNLSSAADKQKRQPIISKPDVEKFIQNLMSAKAGSFSQDIFFWLSQNLTSYKSASLIFLQHSIDVTQLFVDGDESLQAAYDSACSALAKETVMGASFGETYAEMYAKYEGNKKRIKEFAPQGNQDPEKVGAWKKENAVLEADMHTVYRMLDGHRAERRRLIAEMALLQSAFNKVHRKFREDTAAPVSKFILNKENFEWSDYLYDKPDIMIVMLGGAKSFTNYEIRIDNEQQSYQAELADLVRVIQSQGLKTGMAGGRNDKSSCAMEVQEDLIPISFILLKRSHIKPPATIRMIEKKDVKMELAKIHEKSYLSFNVGLALQDLENKVFTLNGKNELTVKTDALDKTKLKLHMMALMEVFPFGRDYDRLKGITESENIPFIQRLGMVAGVRISADPLSSIFMGGSLAMSKEFSITAGMVYNQVAKDVTDLPVGLNATLDYLKQNAAREYVPGFYIGISLAPAKLFKTLGITK